MVFRKQNSHFIFSFTLIVLLLNMPLTPSYAAVGAKYKFELDPQGFYQMSAQAESSLIWPENALNEVNVTITVENLPDDNISGITIVAINLILQLDRNNESNPINVESKLFNENMKNETEQLHYSVLIDSPTVTDQFVIKIEILAITTGNITQDINDPPAYSFFFPDEPNSIFVERNQAKALINLYGFPPTSYMLMFGAMFLALASPMVIPAVITFGYLLKDKLDERRKRHEPAVEDTESKIQPEEVN